MLPARASSNPPAVPALALTVAASDPFIAADLAAFVPTTSATSVAGDLAAFFPTTSAASVAANLATFVPNASVTHLATNLVTKGTIKARCGVAYNYVVAKELDKGKAATGFDV